VATSAQGPAAARRGARLPAAPGPGRHAGGRPSPALRRLPRAGRQGGEPHRRHPRQQAGRGGGKGGPSVEPVGLDAGEKVKGVRYHVLVDTLGPLLNVVAHAADIQDRDGAAPVPDHRTRALFPFIPAIFADAGYRGPRAAAAARRGAARRGAARRGAARRDAGGGRRRLRIVRRPEAASGFVASRKRRIVERTLAWLTRCRRLARNLETLARTSVAPIRSAMIKLMARRLAPT
jgi:transposase